MRTLFAFVLALLASAAWAAAGAGEQSDSIVYIGSAPKGSRQIDASELADAGPALRLQESGRPVALDPALLAAWLRRHGEVELELPGALELTGTWSLPPGAIAIHATGSIVAARLRLSAPGARITLTGRTVRLRERPSFASVRRADRPTVPASSPRPWRAPSRSSRASSSTSARAATSC